MEDHIDMERAVNSSLQIFGIQAFFKTQRIHAIRWIVALCILTLSLSACGGTLTLQKSSGQPEEDAAFSAKATSWTDAGLVESATIIQTKISVKEGNNQQTWWAIHAFVNPRSGTIRDDRLRTELVNRLIADTQTLVENEDVLVISMLEGNVVRTCFEQAYPIPGKENVFAQASEAWSGGGPPCS